MTWTWSSPWRACRRRRRRPLTADTLERVQAAAAEAGRKVELLQWSTLLDTVGWYTGNTFTLSTQDGVSTQIQVLTADDYGRLTGRTVALAPDEVLVQAENLALPETFYMEDLPFHVAGTITDFPRYNDSVFISGQTAQLSLVVADEIGAVRRPGSGIPATTAGNSMFRWTWTARRRRSRPLWTLCWRRT